ncbi:MAG TPA: carotenoid biosynthesis protein [Chthoniobacterales bacterium]
MAPFSRWSRVTQWVFYLWTAVGFLVVPFNLTEDRLRLALASTGLGDVAGSILNGSDAIWLWLGAITTLAAYAAEISWTRAWAGALGLGGAAAAIELIGVATGFPFGPYAYTDRLGPRLGSVLPVTIPAAWYIIVANGHALVPATRWRPVFVGLIAVGTDLSLEAVAWKIRGYWEWYPGQALKPGWPPWQNYASWFLVGAALDWVFLRRLDLPRLRWRAAAVLTVMNLLFWGTVLTNFLGRA